MSMTIQTTFEVGPSAGAASQSQAISDAQKSGEAPSFFEVLARSLQPDADVPGKKMAKVAATARHQDQAAADDKVDPQALLMGIHLPVLLPEPKPGQRLAGGATAVKDELHAVRRGGLPLPAAATDQALVAVNGATHPLSDLDLPLTDALPSAAQASLQEAQADLALTGVTLSVDELPGVEALNAVLAKMAPVTGDAGHVLPDAPAAVNALTAAVQTLTQNLRRTPSPEGAQAGVPAGKEVPAKLPVAPGLALGQAAAADPRPPARAGMNAGSGQLGRSADIEAAPMQAGSAKTEGQFSATLEALTADDSKPVLSHAVGALVSASMAPSGTSNEASTPLRSYLAPEVGSQGWDKALGQQMAQMGKPGHQLAELQLNPPGLGPLKVTLDLNDHQMQLTFVSSHASVRAAVEAAMPQLRATLADNGISLGNTSVSAESQAQDQTAFSQGQGRAPDHRAYPSRQLPDNAAPVAQSVPATRRAGGGLAVDTYA